MKVRFPKLNISAQSRLRSAHRAALSSVLVACASGPVGSGIPVAGNTPTQQDKRDGTTDAGAPLQTVDGSTPESNDSSVGGTGGSSGRKPSGGGGGGGARQAAAGSGGESGRAGSGQAVAPTPPTPAVVHDCTNLPKPGSWERITPEGVKASALLMVDPFEGGVVWVNGQEHGMYRSNDCGATWKLMTEGKNAAEFAKGAMVSGMMDRVDRGTMYIVPIYGSGGVFKSTNGGQDWEQLIPGDTPDGKVVEYNFYDSVSMDPTNNQHLVVGTHADCAAPYGPACQAETMDGGKTWRFVKIPGKGWAEQAGPWVINETTWLYGSPDGLFLTTNNGMAWDQVQVKGGAFGFGGGEVENHSITIGKDGTYYMSSYQGVVRSKDGLAWENIPGLTARTVGLVLGDGVIYASDQWSTAYFSANEDEPTEWTTLPKPYDMPADAGGVYLDYDATHHILYSSNFAGGVWRMVMR